MTSHRVFQKVRHGALVALGVLFVFCFPIAGSCSDSPSTQEPGALELDIASKQVTEWGGKIAGETLEQGDDLNHVKLTFKQDENPQKRSEIGIVVSSELPDFTKVTMDVFSNAAGGVRIRVEDASRNPYIVKVPVNGEAWTSVEFNLDEKSGKAWPPLKPFRSFAILASTTPGVSEQKLEIKNVRLITE